MILVPHLPRIFVVALLAWTSSGILGGDVQADARNAMVEAMVKMMQAMGVFDPSSLPSMPMGTVPVDPYAWNPGVSSFGMPGASAWSGAVQDPSAAMEKGGDMVKQFSDGMRMPKDIGTGLFPGSLGTPLEGIWEGRGGELLIVQGNRFRIYPGNAGYIDGYFQLRGERLAMYNPKNANIRPFEYAESEGRLVLRDEAGTLYLYRRLWLEGRQGANKNALPQR